MCKNCFKPKTRSKLTQRNIATELTPENIFSDDIESALPELGEYWDSDSEHGKVLCLFDHFLFVWNVILFIILMFRR